MTSRIQMHRRLSELVLARHDVAVALLGLIAVRVDLDELAWILEAAEELTEARKDDRPDRVVHLLWERYGHTPRS